MTEHKLEFTESENPWVPTAVVAEINERAGLGLVLTGLSGQVGGTSSAAFVRWPDGRECALTRTTTSVSRMKQTAEVLSMARAHGLPVPRHDAVLPLADGRTAVVQERLPGGEPASIDLAVIDALVGMNDRFAGLLAGWPDVPPPDAFPEPGDNGWAGSLGRFSDRSARLLKNVERIEGAGLYQMTGDDLVHTDYNIGNVLFDGENRITGLVDWNFGAARGDRRYSLLHLRANLVAEQDVAPDVLAHLDEIIADRLPASLLLIYRRHHALLRLHHAIMNEFPADDIVRALDLVESTLESRY